MGRVGLRRLLVLGGARSGKSGFAQRAAEASGLRLLYVATAARWGGHDPEMDARIAAHAAARGPDWDTLEEPQALAAVVRTRAGPGRALLIDCATLWLTNRMLAGHDLDADTRDLAAAVRESPGPVILVSNEVGSGIVPETALGRGFRDAQGRLNQALAEACDAVVLVVAGLPVRLKPAPSPAFDWT